MAALAITLVLAVATAAPTGVRYATTPVVDPDRCATAWVIRRFVDPAATFEFHPEDELPADATPFDVPDAELRRDAQRAAVEILVARESLTDPFVLQLAHLVHDIEIRAWARPADAPSIAFERDLMEKLLAAPDPEAALDVCFASLDALRAGEVSP